MTKEVRSPKSEVRSPKSEVRKGLVSRPCPCPVRALPFGFLSDFAIRHSSFLHFHLSLWRSGRGSGSDSGLPTHRALRYVAGGESERRVSLPLWRIDGDGGEAGVVHSTGSRLVCRHDPVGADGGQIG